MESLCAEFELYLSAQGLTGPDYDGDAHELLMGAELTVDQRDWLENFIERWDSAIGA